MQGRGQGQHKLRHRGLEGLGVLCHTKELAHHAAAGRIDADPAGVFKSLTRPQQGLAPHHSQAVDLLFASMCIHNHPMASDELGGHIAGVVNGDGVGKRKLVGGRIGLLWERADSHAACELGMAHGVILCSQGLPRDST